MTEFILKAGATYQMYKSDNQGTDNLVIMIQFHTWTDVVDPYTMVSFLK